MRGGLAAAVLLHVVLATGYDVAVPLFEAPDEPDHFRYALVLATAGHLPVHRGHALRLGRHVLDECGLAHHPPLYYGLLAGALALLDAEDLVASLPLENADAPPDRRRSWKFGHGFDERWPWSDEVVLLKLLRGLSVLLGAVTIVLVHRLGRVSFPRRPAVADLGALLLATLPAWSYAHGVLDNGNLAATLAHVVLLLCATSLARGRLPLGLAVALGTSWAAALLAKLTALGLCLPLGFVALRHLRRAPHPARVGRALAVGSAIVAVALAGFLLRNRALYGDLLGAGAHAEAFARSRVPDGARAEWLLFGLPRGLVESASSPSFLDGGAPFATAGLLLLLAAAALGGARRFRREGDSEGLAPSGGASGDGGRAQIVLLALAVLGTAGVFVRFNVTFEQPQARYLFPAAGPIGLLVALGLARLGDLLPRGARRAAGLGLAAALAGGALALLFLRVVPEVAVTEVSPSVPAAIAVGVRGRPAPPGEERVRLVAPSPGAALAQAPTFRWEPPPDAERSAESTWFVRVIDRDGRILLDSLAHLGLVSLEDAWAVPQAYWDTLPAGVELTWYVRRAPDRRRGEETGGQPASGGRTFTRPGGRE